MTPHEALERANVRAFLRVIRAGESSQDDNAYSIRWGGSHFDGYVSHPGGVTTAHGIVSSAAGAYQFLASTWREVQEAMGLPDFSPASQDLGAVYLVRRRGALDDVIAGRLAIAIQKCRLEWTSFQTVDYARLESVYLQYGGKLGGASQQGSDAGPTVSPAGAAAAPPATDEYSSQGNMPAPPVKEATMVAPALVTALLPSLIESIPKLGKIFAGGEVSTRNVEAAGIVLDTVRKATGAVNEQEALQKIKSDPVALQAAQQAVTDRWLELTEAGGGGIEGARKSDPAGKGDLLHSASLWIGLALLPLVYLIVANVVGLIGKPLDDQVRAAVANGVVGMVLGGLIGYYFGQTTSRNRTPSVGSA